MPGRVDRDGQHVSMYLLLLWNVWINYERLSDADTEKSAPELIRGDEIRINKETS